jgi:hypothetical protein
MEFATSRESGLYIMLIFSISIYIKFLKARPIDQVRNFYERLVAQFNNAGRFWKAYVEHELRAKNFENVEKVYLLYILLY